MGALGPQALPLYIAAVLALLGVYALFRRRHVSALVYGHPAHFEPMTQTSPLALEMMYDDAQPDLFDEPFNDVDDHRSGAGGRGADSDDDDSDDLGSAAFAKPGVDEVPPRPSPSARRHE
ncbi:hypothetical protein [Halomonas sp. E19]